MKVKFADGEVMSVPDGAVAERQMATEIGQVKPNHRARYAWARCMIDQRIEEGFILDAAAGTGYGARMIAESGHVVDAYDCSEVAQAWHQRFFAHPHVHFALGTIPTLPVDARYAAVVSLETIEHIEDAPAWIAKIGEVSNLLIATVPNQNVVPYDKASHPFHYRHYTKADVEHLMAGWTIEGWYTQYDKWDPERCLMRPGDDGMTLGFVASK